MASRVKMTTMMMFLFLLLTSLAAGAFWSPSPPPHQQVIVKEGHRVVVVEFEEERSGNTEVSISNSQDNEFESSVGGGERNPSPVAMEEEEDTGKPRFTGPRELFNKCRKKVASAFWKTKDVGYDLSNKICNIERDVKEAVDEAVGLVGEPKGKLSDKLSEKLKIIGGKLGDAAANARSAATEALTTITFGDITKGTIKDSIVKMKDWDAVDSPKRIGEDIERNASRKIDQKTEEVKETVESVKKTSLSELITKFRKMISDVLVVVSLQKLRGMISWCHLSGFSTAYGMGMWVTFVLKCGLGKSLPKQQLSMVLNKMNMVYFRLMASCVGAAFVGYVVSQGTKRVLLNKMEIFQGFNLLSALCMIFINLIVLEPRATKLINERMKMQKEEQRDDVAAQKLKKINTYSSSLNVSIMVVLTWHLTYIAQLLQDRH